MRDERQHLFARHFRHPQIEQHQRHRLRVQHFERLFAVHAADAVRQPFAEQLHFVALQGVNFIVNQQYRRAVRRTRIFRIHEKFSVTP